MVNNQEKKGVYSPINQNNYIEISHTKFLDLGISQTHPDYDLQLPLWEYLSDLYDGISAWTELTPTGYKPNSKTQCYLPRHIEEDHESYCDRLNRSYFDDRFASACRRFVDLTFRNGVGFTGESDFLAHFQRLTQTRESGMVFLPRLAIEVMCFGHAWVFVDYPNSRADSYADYLGRSPYWILYRPQQVINWHIVDGRTVQATTSQTVIRSEGLKRQRVRQYWVFVAGRWDSYTEVPRGDRQPSWLVCSGEISLDYVPMIPVYGGLYRGDGSSLPPLRSLADKNRALYQTQSDHSRKVSLCCQPVPVLRDQMREDEPLRIGPNSYVQIRDPSGSFEWQEPLADSLEESRKDLQNLESSLAFDAANFLTSPSDRQSATATNLLTSPLEASLQGFINAFLAGVNEAVKIHCDYVGVQPVEISLDADVFPDSFKDSQASFALQNLFTNGVLSHKTTLQALEILGLLPPVNLDYEVQQANLDYDNRQRIKQQSTIGSTGSTT